ncbi:4-galactosyl-N-acetylglucosaminide 3-alpha-L-fucosyltransferase FUT6 isoform X1 [Anabrus simplex]|uniref:4-galactosyl-N-acetylglucosaminide 3-alpha-L-fucosyltransferase FUT6 isoform X1 n=1 Tax=Anabrus simplex TaxID=316456 RepID=UPI0035A39AAE
MTSGIGDSEKAMRAQDRLIGADRLRYGEASCLVGRIPHYTVTMRHRERRFILLAVVVASMMMMLLLPIYRPVATPFNGIPAYYEGMCNEETLNISGVGNLSRLGDMLFHHNTEGLVPQNKSFTILIWKLGKFLERRMLKRFTSDIHDPFEGCSVSNCKLSYKDEDLDTADAVLFHLHQLKGDSMLPPRKPRPPHQRWVFLSDESPYNTFWYKKNNKWEMYDGLFNWSMTYRMDSDVPVPYGRTIPLDPEEQRQIYMTLPHNYAKDKTALVAVMGSNCGGRNGRWDYIHELQKHVRVDVYGRCGNLNCPGHFTKECSALSKYKFYLAFENSNCRDYVTEKAWWNAYHYGAVPVIMGISQEDSKRLLPPKSYIHASEFASPADLARFLQYLDKSHSEYNAYFEWKKCFKVLNEHGYFQTPVFHYCRLCEALNYNDPSPKVYNKLQDFWSDKYCYDKYWS